MDTEEEEEGEEEEEEEDLFFSGVGVTGIADILEGREDLVLRGSRRWTEELICPYRIKEIESLSSSLALPPSIWMQDPRYPRPSFHQCNRTRKTRNPAPI